MARGVNTKKIKTIKGSKIIKRNIVKKSSFEKKNSLSKKSSFSVYEVVAIAILTSFISMLMGFVLSNSSKNTSFKALSEDMQNFLNEYDRVTEQYYGEYNEKEVLDSALKTIIDELGDPYTGVVDDSLENSLSTKLKGSYEGIGVQIRNTSSGALQIVSVLKNSPAEKAHLKAYDYIKKFEGKDVSYMTTTDFSNLVKKSDSEVLTITIERESKTFDVKIKRELVVLDSVSSDIFKSNGKNIGYIYINIFAANTDTQFKKALDELEQKSIDSLIIDVRSNSGGHLSTVANIMNYFVDNNYVIYQIKGKSGTVKYYSKGKNTKTYPIAVLANEASASASEMLTACLKDNLNALVIGKKTFGKGTVQEVQSTNSGIKYKITTNNWLTPNGTSINENGIEPDVEIEIGDNYFKNPVDENDMQLQKAIELLSK